MSLKRLLELDGFFGFDLFVFWLLFCFLVEVSCFSYPLSPLGAGTSLLVCLLLLATVR